jgi:hypothetical protein
MPGRKKNVAHMGESRGVDRFYWGNQREEDHLEGPGRWEDNIKMVIREVEWGLWTGSI